jgi:type I restriction enzyme M protein
MLLHGVKDTEFEIHHGDTLLNEWDILNQMNPAKKLEFDAIVANPPFSYRWEPTETMGQDFRFKNYGLLSKEGTMAIILPHGVLFRGGKEQEIRKKLIEDGNIDTVIGLPSNLFYSTGIPVCIVVLKKCKKPDDVLIINAAEHFEKGKRQNFLPTQDIERIINAYKYRTTEDRYSRPVPIEEIKENDYNLNITRYVNTVVEDEVIDLAVVNAQLVDIEKKAAEARAKHNQFLKELGLPPI